VSLRTKIVLILVTVVLAYAGLDNGMQRFFAGLFFGRWEREGAVEDLARIRGRIEGEIDDLVNVGRLFARSEAMSRFVAGELPEYAETDLGTAVLERARVDLFYVCAADGRVLWSSLRDPSTHQPLRLPEFPRESLARNNPALVVRPGEQHVEGVIMTHAHPLLFSTMPVRLPGAADSGGELVESGNGYLHPAHGAVILGRFLGPELEQAIVGEELALAREGEVTMKRIELLEAGSHGVPPEVVRADGQRLIQEGEDGLLHAYERMGALRTDLPLILHVALDRPIEAHKRMSVNYALLSTLIGGLLILSVLLRLLQYIVIAPLSTLTTKAVEIGRRDDTTIRVGLDRKDEIGQLAGEFDRMLEKLARSREQVVETARLAGMSEIATGVLHNVGNVLNSVNVSANLATKKTEDLAIPDLQALVEVLQGHEGDLASFVGTDERGKHLVPFLKELAGDLGTQRRAIQDELRSLNQGMEHIAELVRAQQSYAGAKGVFEYASLEDQLEAAVKICKQGLDAHGIRIERDYEELPSIRIDKHKMMEILVNLVQNASQAMAEHGGEDLRLRLAIRRLDEHTARIQVSDTGIGIAAENITRVFHHGFTTKKHGHGFGLHVSANAATEMGAKLHASSEGPGKGATFYLDLHMEPESAASAA